MKKLFSIASVIGVTFCVLLLSAVCASASRLLGDVNGDGKISLQDASMIQRGSLNKITLTDEETKAADVNGDNAVTLRDASAVQKHVLGLELIPDTDIADSDSDTDTATDSDTDSYSDTDSDFNTDSDNPIFDTANTANRIKLIELINADRTSRGLSPLEYNDESLSVGQTRAQEYIDGYITLRPDGRSLATVFSDCGINVSNSVEYSAGSQKSATNIYNCIKKDKNGVYENYFMSPDYKAIVIGSVPNPNNSRITVWVIDLGK